MAFRAFTLAHVYERQSPSKEKDKSGIQCVECWDQNVYIGTKDATVRHLVLPAGADGGPGKTGERGARKLGSGNPVARLRVVPLLNHLLVLWDRGVTALNMFSLEPVAGLKKIQHVGLFEVGGSALASREPTVEMVTSSSRGKAIRIHAVGADRWEVVREVPLLQEPVALAVDGAYACVGTSGRYLLCDIRTGRCDELFPHGHGGRRVVVASMGRGEFLLNGPESLGVFVMKTGECQRPPLQWPQEVLAAAVCFPYILTLQPQALSVYSAVDQQCKQTENLSGARGLCATPDGALVFTERDIFSLRLVPLKEQTQALVRLERFEEALLLLDGVQGRRPLDSCKELQKDVSCLAGFAHFHQEGFSEASVLFTAGGLDPRELLRLYPGFQVGLGEDFQSRLDQPNKGRGLQVLCQQDRRRFHHYLVFLGDFLRAVRGTERGLECSTEVDCALLRLYVELGDAENLQQLVSLPNACRLAHCRPVLEQHSRYFALGSLYQSHGNHIDAIKTWVKIADGLHKDPSCPDVYGHIVQTLSQLRDGEAVWTFADWTLRRNQEIGVQIFSRRPADARFGTQEVLALVEKYPLALLLYLEFLIHDLNSEEERHHSRLALAYVAQSLREEEESRWRTRGKLQQLLWESKFYAVSAVYERVESAALHKERAILLGRTAGHFQALQVLVSQEADPQAAEAYCRRAARGRDTRFLQSLLLTLLRIYLSSEGHRGAAVDLLNNNPRVLAAEEVLQLLPGSWSVQLVSQFLVGSLRETFHQRRMAMVQKAMGRAELMRHKVIWMQASQTKLHLDKGQKCQVCQRDLAEPQFACNPAGGLMHTSCPHHDDSGQ